MMPTEDIYQPLLNVIEFLGTFAFAISGIRHAAAKRFDWFGGFVCGVAVAIGGGTLRDIMLGVTPFWMTSSIYLIQKEIYAMASIIGGLAYWALVELGCDMTISVIIAFLLIVAIRILAVKYHISLPVLRGEE